MTRKSNKSKFTDKSAHGKLNRKFFSLQRNFSVILNRKKHVLALKNIQIRQGFSFNTFKNAVDQCNWKMFTDYLWENIAHLKQIDQIEYVFQNELKNPFATNLTIQKLSSHFAKSIESDVSQSCPPLQFREKIKNIAIHCSFWDAPTCRNQILPWLNNASDFGFKVTLLGCSKFGFGPAGNRLSFIDTENLPLLGFQNLIQKKKTDVFIDLNGLSPMHRIREMSTRIAPWQVSYMNHTATLGLKNIDYIVADDISLPKSEEIYYAEKILRIKKCFFCFSINNAKLSPAQTIPCLKNKCITFGCFGSAGKLNQQLIDLYCRVLKRVPNSRIILQNLEFCNPITKKCVEKLFADQGISKSRVDCRLGTSHLLTLQSYNSIDISLDTFPYNGGNTIAESLFMGVPVISLKGARFSSRYGGSILSHSGCNDLVANSEEMFINIAERLSTEKSRLVWLRKNLRRMCYENSFSNTTDFASRFFSAINQLNNT